MKTIVAAVDFSEISDTVVAEAAALAKASGGRVLLLSVVQPPVITTEYAPSVANVAGISAAAEKSIANRLTQLQQRLSVDGVESESVQRNGAPVPHIVAEARNHEADCVVMGSHGHNALYDLLVGSTTHGVLLRAPCPVLIIPPKSGRRAPQP